MMSEVGISIFHRVKGLSASLNYSIIAIISYMSTIKCPMEG